MADDLSARLRIVADNIRDDGWLVAALVVDEAADALDAAPPPERVLPEGVTVDDVAWAVNLSTARDAMYFDPRNGPARFLRIQDALSPDSGADPEPQRVIVDFAEVEPQHSPLRTWPADPKGGTDG